ncbi:MAG: MBL fold metallo-hydrolase [Deinococcota bacterium]
MTNSLESNTSTKKYNRRHFLKGLGLATGGALLGASGMWQGLNWWYDIQQSSPNSPREGVAVPSTTATTPSGIRIHHIQTGFVAVKSVHLDYDDTEGRGIPAIATDPNWGNWLPVTVWVIEHPEGVIVIDTGEDPKVNDPDYFACNPRSGFFYDSFLRLSITPDEAINVQLASLGIRPSDVRWVVQTHLHGDHVHGIQHFPQAQILMSGLDYPTSLGAVPCLYPDWLEPTLVNFQTDDTPVFARSYPLTQARDVRIVPTPGHTNGHQSVVLFDEDYTYFFAGDTSRDEETMLGDTSQAIAVDPTNLRVTTTKIRQYAMENPTIYLPSHDDMSATRLVERATVFHS